MGCGCGRGKNKRRKSSRMPIRTAPKEKQKSIDPLKMTFEERRINIIKKRNADKREKILKERAKKDKK